MQNCAIIAMHHKAGSRWMNETFQDICLRRSIRFSNIEHDQTLNADNCEPPIVVSFPHSQIDKFGWVLTAKPYSIFHLVRDPRDMIISGMHYHRKSREKQLHIARDKFGGLTYQQKLNSLPTDRERYLAEIEYNQNPIQMAAWNYGRPGCLECKYEDLIFDTEMSLFTKILVHLGFVADELDDCREAFWNRSIFGGRASAVGQELHLRSGKVQQWRDVFDQALGIAFVKRFGDVLITLGYEADNSWIDRLPVTRHELDPVTQE